MGLGAAFVMPATLSIIVNVFSDARAGKGDCNLDGDRRRGRFARPDRERLLACEHYSWNAVFLVNIPVVVVALVAGAKLLPKSRDAAATRIDVVGALLSIAGIVGLVYAIIEAPHHGWLSTRTLAVAGAAIVVLGLFVWWELRTRLPMLDMRWFKHRSFSVGSAGMMLAFFALFGMMFLLTQYSAARRRVLGVGDRGAHVADRARHDHRVAAVAPHGASASVPTASSVQGSASWRSVRSC